MNSLHFTVPRLGEAKITSPIKMSTKTGDNMANYVRDDEFILYNIDARPGSYTIEYTSQDLLEKAGPREKIFFSPGHVHAGNVTCGGLCPGLNNVIRALVRTLWYSYGIHRISGIRNGYRGFPVNMGGVQVSSGVAVNNKGFVIGTMSGGPEVMNADQALGFIDN